MCSDRAAFTLGDLAVFDAQHLHLVIGDDSGAVSPALVGRAFAGELAHEPPSLADPAERIAGAPAGWPRRIRPRSPPDHHAWRA